MPVPVSDALFVAVTDVVVVCPLLPTSVML